MKASTGSVAILVFILLVHTDAQNLPHSCADIYKDRVTRTSGVFTIYNRQGEGYQVYCDLQNGYVYTYIHPAVNVEVNIQDLYNVHSNTHVLVRHLRQNNVQYVAKLEQLSQFAGIPLSIQFNTHYNYNDMTNSRSTPYIYVGFLEATRIHHGAVNGYRVNGQDFALINCNDHSNSFFSVLFNHRRLPLLTHQGTNNPLIHKWVDLATQLPPNQYIPNTFFSQYETHFGGCGGFATPHILHEIIGAAVGIKSDIDECVPANPCQNGGTCSNTDGGYHCRCLSGWTRENCQKDVDECHGYADLCLNGGTCTNTPGHYSCKCTRGWAGDRCQSDVDECTVYHPCSNGGTCTNSIGNFSCFCSTGWSGNTCQTDVDECHGYQHTLCLNGGTCTNTPGHYSCQCTRGWSGDRCQSDVDECSVYHPCYNGGTCTNSIGNYSCKCTTGWSGDNCQTDINECLTNNICQNGGTCVNNAGSYACKCVNGLTGGNCETINDACLFLNPCQHGGTCSYTHGHLYCLCMSGWTGGQCQSDIDECLTTNPCQNGGTCINTLGNYNCQCPSGWTGDHCQTDVDECLPLDLCMNKGTCINVPGSFFCGCSDGWKGNRCQTDIDECSLQNTCQNGGTCHNTPGSYKCSCLGGLTGGHCDKDIDECLTTNPCQNGGTCINRLGYYTCQCPNGWTGVYCQTDLIGYRANCSKFESLNLPCIDYSLCNDLGARLHDLCTDAVSMCPVICGCCDHNQTVDTMLTLPQSSSSTPPSYSSEATTSVFSVAQAATTTTPIQTSASTTQLSTSSKTPAIYWEEWGNWRCKTVDQGDCVMFRERNCSTGNSVHCGTTDDSKHFTECKKNICEDLFNLTQCAKYNDSVSHCMDTVSTCSHLNPDNQACMSSVEIASELCPKSCGCCENEVEGYMIWESWSPWICIKLNSGLYTTCHMSRHRLCSTGKTADCAGSQSEIKECQGLDCSDTNTNIVDCSLYNKSTACNDSIECAYFYDHPLLICSDPKLAAKCPQLCACCLIDNTGNQATTLLPLTSTNVSGSKPNIFGLCNFDDDTICTWTQSNEDSFDWRLQSGPTLTEGTGPNNDHTLNTSQGKYLYVETSSPRIAGEQASLLSLELPSNHTVCLEFWYNMFGDGIGSLQVHAQGTYSKNGIELFRKDGNQGESWFKASVTIYSKQIPNNYRLVITGNVGSTYTGDTAIDDLALHDGACAG